MATYLHILNHAGRTQAVLNTRQKITPRQRADLVYSLQNPTYPQEMNAYRVYMSLPGKPDRFTRRVYPEQFQGVGVLSNHKDLNKIPRFTDSGQIKKEDIPVQIRGEELFYYLDKMVHKDGPPHSPENLTPWTSLTCPRKASSVTQEQRSWAKDLREQGVTLRKVADMTGIPFGSLQKVLQAA